MIVWSSVYTYMYDTFFNTKEATNKKDIQALSISGVVLKDRAFFNFSILYIRVISYVKRVV